MRGRVGSQFDGPPRLPIRGSHFDVVAIVGELVGSAEPAHLRRAGDRRHHRLHRAVRVAHHSERQGRRRRKPLVAAAARSSDGRIIAIGGEAGYQADLLRGGIHFGSGAGSTASTKSPLVTIPQGQIGYVYARDGEPLPPSQTLGRVVPCNNFQDARAFLIGMPLPESAGRRLRFIPIGQRGRQRAILREGVYAINLGALRHHDRDAGLPPPSSTSEQEMQAILSWQKELDEIDGFHPVVIGGEIEATDPLRPEQRHSVDSIGIVTVHDGPSLPPGEIIAPAAAPRRTIRTTTTTTRTPRRSWRRPSRPAIPRWLPDPWLKLALCIVFGSSFASRNFPRGRRGGRHLHAAMTSIAGIDHPVHAEGYAKSPTDVPGARTSINRKTIRV